MFVHLRLFLFYLLLKESVALKDVVQLIVACAARNLITDGTLGHIQTERPLSADRIALHTDELDSADTGVLPCIFRKALCLAKVILTGRIVRLQNINDILRAITANDQEIRVCWLLFTVDLIRNTQRP